MREVISVHKTAAYVYSDSRECYAENMSDEFIFTELEYSKMLGITKEGVRSRRRAGKLEGEFTVKDNRIFYKRVRPNNGKTADKNRSTSTASRSRRRGVMTTGEPYKYGNKHSLQKNNDYKALNRIKGTLSHEELTEVNDELVKLAKDKVKQKKMKRLETAMKPTKNYGGLGFRSSPPISTFSTDWKPLFQEPKSRDDKFLEDNDIVLDDDGPSYYW